MAQSGHSMKWFGFLFIPVKVYSTESLQKYPQYLRIWGKSDPVLKSLIMIIILLKSTTLFAIVRTTF